MTPSPNAKTMEETMAPGVETFGVLNQHPTLTPASSVAPSTALPSVLHSPLRDDVSVAASTSGFKVGVSVDKNKKCRRTMEDAHSFIYDFGGIRGQGYFAVFDGHAGKHAAEWCGEHFHEHLLSSLRSPSASPLPIPDVLNTTFDAVDSQLSKLAQVQGTHSGCTAVTVFLRLEDEQGRPVGRGGGVSDEVYFAAEGSAAGAAVVEEVKHEKRKERAVEGGAGLDESHLAQVRSTDETRETNLAAEEEGEKKGKMFTGDGVFRDKVKGLLGGGSVADEFKADPVAAPTSTTAPKLTAEEERTKDALERKKVEEEVAPTPKITIQAPAQILKAARRTLYTANVGDARAVLSRGGRAIRLTYDHKGSDAQEAKRITDAGGFVMNNRVNGVLAVTRSLGDSSMKQFVVGSPYTTETTLGDGDEWLIVACDGLWDVCEDQQAVDIISATKDPQEASRALLDHALQNFSSDNLSVLVVSLGQSG